MLSTCWSGLGKACSMYFLSPHHCRPCCRHWTIFISSIIWHTSYYMGTAWETNQHRPIEHNSIIERSHFNIFGSWIAFEGTTLNAPQTILVMGKTNMSFVHAGFADYGGVLHRHGRGQVWGPHAGDLGRNEENLRYLYYGRGGGFSDAFAHEGAGNVYAPSISSAVDVCFMCVSEF